MKKAILLIITILLVGCSKTFDYVNEININVEVNVTDMVEIEPNVMRFSTVRQDQLSETFQITQVELLDTGWGEFPYESHFIEEKDWKEYVEILNSLFAEISENDSLGGDVLYRTGPKAKLTITLQSENHVIECEFYQDSSNQLSSLTINYSDGNDIDVLKDYEDGYEEFLSRLNDLIG